MNETKIPASLENELGFNLYRVALLFRREFIAAFCEFDLTPEQWHVLAALKATGKGISQNKICDLTLKDRHTVSRMIVRMEKAGWVTRSGDEFDERAVLVSLTSKAIGLVEGMPKRLKSQFHPILGLMSSKERAQMMDILKRLRSFLEKS